MEEVKDRMFQYAYDTGSHEGMYHFSNIHIPEDTGLITEKEANELWEKYYSKVVRNIEENERPQMCIWKDCKSNTDYHTVEREIDWHDDLEIKNGRIYKVKKEVTEIL